MAKHNPYIHTQEYLVHALMQLTRSKPLSSISVTELTNRAGVSRMTYYRNYNSMSEILTRYLDGIFESYKRDVAGFGNPGKYNDYHIVLLCSQYFHTHKDFILCLLRCGMGDLLLSRLTKYVLDTYYCEEKGIA